MMIAVSREYFVTEISGVFFFSLDKLQDFSSEIQEKYDPILQKAWPTDPP